MRAGDIVRHLPSGEEWVVAYQDGEYMSWCGWPEGEARAADCEVVKPATDDEHREWLRRLMRSEGKRKRMALAALEALPIPKDEVMG